MHQIHAFSLAFERRVWDVEYASLPLVWLEEGGEEGTKTEATQGHRFDKRRHHLPTRNTSPLCVVR